MDQLKILIVMASTPGRLVHAQPLSAAASTDFAVRNGLDNATLVELFAWSETDFNDKLAGSPIRRIGYQRWLRNLAVGMGNALSVLGKPGDVPAASAIVQALRARADYPPALVSEHLCKNAIKTIGSRGRARLLPAMIDL